MKLAIQVILYHSSKRLAPLLESLKTQTFQEFETWFLDNSEDRDEAELSRAQVVASGLRHRFIVSETNTGFAGGHQAMFLTHEAPFILLLNDDAQLDEMYLERVMGRIESDTKIGSITGLVYRLDGKTIDTAGLEYKCLAQIVDRHAGLQPTTYHLQPGPVFGVSGAVGLYRRSAIEQAGGLFDPKWFMYKEDADLALRLRKTGFTSWFEPEAIAWHERGFKPSRSLFKRFFDEWKRPTRLRRYAYANQLRIYRKHFRWSLGFVDIVRSFIIETVRSTGTFVMSPSVFFGAWYDVLS